MPLDCLPPQKAIRNPLNGSARNLGEITALPFLLMMPSLPIVLVAPWPRSRVALHNPTHRESKHHRSVDFRAAIRCDKLPTYKLIWEERRPSYTPTDHEIKIRRVSYFYSAAECRSRGALWPGFAPALIKCVQARIFPGVITSAAIC